MHTCPAAHARPHIPQFAASLRTSRSHPVAVLPSQSPNPAVHANVHIAAAHPAVVFGAPVPGHTRPHTPQLRTSVASVASHPLASIVSQFANPVLHDASEHVPAAHVPTPFAGAHARPHAPQCITLVAGLVSHPFVGSASQLLNAESHAPITHDPVEHVPIACVNMHTRPHIPQFAMLARVSVSQPFAELMSQLPVPTAQSRPHRPEAHVGVAVPAVGHTFPHAPQLAISVITSMHRVPHTVERAGGHAQCPSRHV